MTLQEIKKLNRDEFDEKYAFPMFTWNGDNATGKRAAQQVRRKLKSFISLCETRLLEGVVEMIKERLKFGVENKQMLDLKQSLTKEIK